MSNNKDNNPVPAISNNILEALNIVLKNDFVHVREISRLIGISPTTASTSLKELEENGILTKKTLGKNCFYSLKKSHKTRKFIAIAENYKFLKGCRNKGFSEFSESLLKDMNDIKGFVDFIIAYKSEGKEKSSVLFVTSLDHETIKIKIMKSGKDAEKMTVFTRENFRNNLDNDIIKGMLKDYIILYGAERFVELVY